MVQSSVLRESSFMALQSVGSPPGTATRRGGPSLVPAGVKLAQSPAQKAEALWSLILQHLAEDWGKSASLNLGVRSGTAVLEELQVRKLHSWVQKLHLLAISHNSAAETISKAARQLTPGQLQQMQVMLDTIGDEHLADFLRLSVYNVSSPFATKAVDAVHGARQHRRARRGRGRGKPGDDHPDVSSSQQDALPARAGPRPAREELIRFCGFLPEDHPLVQRAYRLYLSRLPPEPEDAGQPDGSALQGRGTGRRLGRPRYGPATSLQEEWAASEAERRRPPELPLWTDVERRWQQTCHTHHRHELLNPLMVAPAMELYQRQPDFLRKLQEQQAAAIASQMSVTTSPQRAGGSITRPTTASFTAMMAAGAGAADQQQAGRDRGPVSRVGSMYKLHPPSTSGAAPADGASAQGSAPGSAGNNPAASTGSTGPGALDAASRSRFAAR